MSGLAVSTALPGESHAQSACAPIAIDWNLAFRREPTRKACDYWSSLCAGRAMPRRKDLAPKAMRGFLRHINLIDIRAGSPSEYVLSLQGQHALDTFGPIAQRNLDDALPAHIAQRWRYCLDIAHRAARPVRFSSRICAGGKLWLDSESLIAPLGDDAAGIDSLFLAFVSWPAESPPPK